MTDREMHPIVCRRNLFCLVSDCKTSLSGLFRRLIRMMMTSSFSFYYFLFFWLLFQYLESNIRYGTDKDRNIEKRKKSLSLVILVRRKQTPTSIARIYEILQLSIESKQEIAAKLTLLLSDTLSYTFISTANDQI